MSSQEARPNDLQQRYIERRLHLERLAPPSVLSDAQDGDVAAYQQVFEAARPLAVFVAHVRDRNGNLDPQQQEEIALGEIGGAVIDFPGKPAFYQFLGARIMKAVDTAVADEFERELVPNLAPVPEHILPDLIPSHRLLMWNIFQPYKSIAEAKNVSVDTVRSSASKALHVLGFARMETAAAVHGVKGNVDMSQVPGGNTERLTDEEKYMLLQCHILTKDIKLDKTKPSKIYEKMEAVGRIQATLMMVKDGEINEQTLQAIGLTKAD